MLQAAPLTAASAHAGGADTITVNGGTLTVNASGDGLDSNGALTINARTVYVSGPPGDGNGNI